MMKIPCYILCFNEFLNFKITFEFLEKQNCFDFKIIENYSQNSENLFKPYINYKMKQGLVSEHYLFDQNISTNAYDIVFRLKHITKDDANSKYIMITDGDIMPLFPSWLEEEIYILEKYPQVLCANARLLTVNSPTRDHKVATINLPTEHDEYIQCLSGWWLTLYRTSEFYEACTEIFQAGLKIFDYHFQLYSEQTLRHMAQTKKTCAVHLTNYNYLDLNDEYGNWKMKTGYQAIWCHNEYSSFLLQKPHCKIRYELADNLNLIYNITTYN